MKVNFIGIGAIGLPMARQIAQAGHEVTGLDVMPQALDNARVLGIQAVSRVADLPEADVTALPAPISTYWVIMSTVGPASVRVQGEALRKIGARVVDAPVTGGVTRAKTGQLKIFAAGAAEDVDAVRPVLDALGEVRDTGPALGDGQAMKVVNQHLCSVHFVAAAGHRPRALYASQPVRPGQAR